MLTTYETLTPEAFKSEKFAAFATGKRVSDGERFGVIGRDAHGLRIRWDNGGGTTALTHRDLKSKRVGIEASGSDLASVGAKLEIGAAPQPGETTADAVLRTANTLSEPVRSSYIRTMGYREIISGAPEKPNVDARKQQLADIGKMVSGATAGTNAATAVPSGHEKRAEQLREIGKAARSGW